jgi:hypothetical protein
VPAPAQAMTAPPRPATGTDTPWIISPDTARLIDSTNGRVRRAGTSEPSVISCRVQLSRVFGSRRMTLPVGVLGRSGTKRTERGRL